MSTGAATECLEAALKERVCRGSDGIDVARGKEAFWAHFPAMGGEGNHPRQSCGPSSEGDRLWMPLPRPATCPARETQIGHGYSQPGKAISMPPSGQSEGLQTLSSNVIARQRKNQA